jgi:NAD(P)-dependent dehydrogenase (short-subunit alcohol dehydrogenase family)
LILMNQSDLMRTNVAGLKGKIAAVTGGSKGIGRAAALALARQGADVMVISRKVEEGQKVAAEIQTLGCRSQAIGLDVKVRSKVDEVFSSIIPAFGGLDIFVNNAGITTMKRLLETSPEEIDRILDTNLKGAIHCLTNASRYMIRQGRGGNIILMTSINALWPLPSQAVYSATKAALEALMRCLASDLARSGIRVNSVAPGAIYTDMNSHFTPEVIEKLNAKIPLGRIGEPQDIGEVVSFLASDAARYITGATIVADGGYLLRG